MRAAAPAARSAGRYAARGARAGGRMAMRGARNAGAAALDGVGNALLDTASMGMYGLVTDALGGGAQQQPQEQYYAPQYGPPQFNAYDQYHPAAYGGGYGAYTQPYDQYSYGRDGGYSFQQGPEYVDPYTGYNMSEPGAPAY